METLWRLHISIHLMLLFIFLASPFHLNCSYFNTSHVTVYPDIQCDFTDLPLFQYISCYCLSYIELKKIDKDTYFNTSHVTVYLCQQRGINMQHAYFNTSHVTVYRLCLLVFLFVHHFNTSHVTVYPQYDASGQIVR